LFSFWASISVSVAQPTFTEYAVPNCNQVDGNCPSAITTGPDGALWFTKYYTNEVGRITTSGVITTYSAPGGPNGSGPLSITAGSDGALWFTESIQNNIGRITTAGVLTVFAIPTPSSGTGSITAGPDGALWFAEENVNKIGRITTDGAITEYPSLGTCSRGVVCDEPVQITTGPDGALWFTTFPSEKIGRITTGGVVTDYPIPTAFSEPYSITAGPDGALWFTEISANKIGRITTSGVVTEYSVPGVSTITTGPDGALWFTDPLNNAIGQITVTGAVTEYSVPTASSALFWITNGPDGALWFTESVANKIGRAALSYNPAADNQAQQVAPISLGTSGSNVNDLVPPNCCGGTLGSLVRDTSGKTYILSNNHTLARMNQGKAGEHIIQRGYIDTVPTCSTTGTITVAQLSSFVPIAFGGASNTVDAAIAQTLPGSTASAGAILGIGTVSTTTAAPKLGMHVEKAGEGTGLTFGNIDSVNVTVNINYPTHCGSTQFRTAKYIKQFTIIPQGTVSAKGDSGALILRPPANGKSANPVGLLFASDSTGRTVANPVRAVLSRLSSLITTGPLTFVGTSAAEGEVADERFEGIDPNVDAASRVKDRYDDFLLGLPEAVGHGISYSKSGSGKVVIRLFLRRVTDAALRSAPTVLEGVPVEVEATGEYSATVSCVAPKNGTQNRKGRSN
jgi:virginiamycin B lyase